MNAYEAYVMFLALKRHFTTKDYDYFKYAGKVKTSVAAFEKRNDRYFFEKLSRMDDPKGFLLAACTRDDPNKLFIGSLMRDNKYAIMYLDYKNTANAIEYSFDNQMNGVHGPDFQVKGGHHPRVIDLYFQKEINLEALVIIANEAKLLPYWNTHIRDTLIWPDVAMKIKKYSPFVRYDKEKVRKSLGKTTK